MARIARVVVPDLPHHVTQRGNRRELVFFEADDYRLYRRLVAAPARRAGTAVWAYYLLPNHVHLIVTPADADGLRATFAEAHRRYTGRSTLSSGGRAICSRSLRGGGDGRAAFIGGGPLHRSQSGGRGVGEPCRGLRAQLAGEDDELATVAPLRALVP